MKTLTLTAILALLPAIAHAQSPCEGREKPYRPFTVGKQTLAVCRSVNPSTGRDEKVSVTFTFEGKRTVLFSYESLDGIELWPHSPTLRIKEMTVGSRAKHVPLVEHEIKLNGNQPAPEIHSTLLLRGKAFDQEGVDRLVALLNDNELPSAVWVDAIYELRDYGAKSPDRILPLLRNLAKEDWARDQREELTRVTREVELARDLSRSAR